MAHDDAHGRIESLKQVVMYLQAGWSVDEVRAKFRDVISGVTAQEISQMEQALISDGIPVEDVQRLCDVHASVFRAECPGILSTHSSERTAPRSACLARS